MRNRLYQITLIALATATVAPSRAHAGGCQHCGCDTACNKVCRLVCEEKKVTVTCWGCKCEDFCVPGPSKPGCKNCDLVCETCDNPDAIMAQPKKFVWTEWIPGCATVHTRKKLMKRTVVKTVPSYKWVVENLCAKCEMVVVPVQRDARIPAPPAVSADVKILPVSVALAE